MINCSISGSFEKIISNNITGTTIDSTSYDEKSNSWLFIFSNKTSIAFYGIWRLFKNSKLYVTSNDHGQLFGQKKPFNAVEILYELKEYKITSCIINKKSTDINIRFNKIFELEFISDSAGNENWIISVSGGKDYIGHGYDISMY